VIASWALPPGRVRAAMAVIAAWRAEHSRWYAHCPAGGAGYCFTRRGVHRWRRHMPGDPLLAVAVRNGRLRAWVSGPVVDLHTAPGAAEFAALVDGVQPALYEREDCDDGLLLFGEAVQIDRPEWWATMENAV